MSIKSFSIVAAAAMSLFAGAAQAGEQIFNGGFETVDPNNSSLAAGWLPTGDLGYVRTDAEAYDGSWSMLFNGTVSFKASGAEQNSIKDGLGSPLVVGAAPLLTFFAKGTKGETGDLKVRLVYVDSGGNRPYDSGFQPFAPNALSQTTWNSFSMQGPEVTQAGLAVFVQFNLGMGPVDTGVLTPGKVYIDNLSVQAIPEPGTYALMLAGLAGVGFMARRRRAA